MLVYAAIFFVALNNVSRRQPVQWLSLVLVVLAAGIAAYGVYQWGTKSNRVWTFIRPAVYGGRGSGTYICPNHFAGFLEMVLPLGLAFALAGRGGTLLKILVGYASLVMAMGIAVSQSRAGWAAAAAALLLLFALKIQSRNYRAPALALLAVLVGAGMFLVAKTDVVGPRFSKASLSHEHGSGTIRREIWTAAVGLWRDHPLAGVGPGEFDHWFPAYRPAAIGVQNRPERVHNDYLNTLVDWGLAGFVLVCSAWLFLFLGVVRVWKYIQRPVGDFAKQGDNQSAGQSVRVAFVSGATVGLAALLFHSLFDFNMHIPANAILAVTLMALLCGHWRFATDRWWCGRAATRAFVTLVAVGGVIYLGGQAGRRAVETYWLAQAGRAPAQSPELIANLKHAHATEAMNPDTAFRVGEFYRLESWAGEDDYREKAETAIAWFDQSAALNPHDAYAPLRRGMCRDWLGKTNEASSDFERVARLDPNSYYIIAYLGWHQFQLGNLARAREYFQRSLELTPWQAPNPLSHSYLDLIERRLKGPPSLLDRR
ncbi:MAG TPA: O-antigen ligase family protein [Verrucomicrobiae bacterium]